MASSTRESILTVASDVVRNKGYAVVAMKDVAEASGAPIGSLCHHFRVGKVPAVVDPSTDPGEAIEGTLREAARWRDMFRGGSHRRLARR